MDENIAKEIYTKPEAEIVSIEVEQPILNGSGNAPDFGNGGRWGF